MTERVDFYVLASAAPGSRLAFACRLTEKAYLRNLRVIVLAESAADVAAMDDLLWTFNDRSFVPHKVRLDAQAEESATPVHLCVEPPVAPTADLAVNLASRLPLQPERFARIAEIIDADPQRRQLGRERFKSYRDLKFTLETHQLDGPEDP